MQNVLWLLARASGTRVRVVQQLVLDKALPNRLKLLLHWNLETFHTFVATDHAHAEVVLQTLFRLSNHQKLVKGDTCTSCFLYQVRQTYYMKYGFEFTWFGNPMSYLMK